MLKVFLFLGAIHFCVDGWAADVATVLSDEDKESVRYYQLEDAAISLKNAKEEELAIKKDAIKSLTQGMPHTYQEIYRIMFEKLFQVNREDEFLEIYKRAFEKAPIDHNEITNRINSIDFALKKIGLEFQI